MTNLRVLVSDALNQAGLDMLDAADGVKGHVHTGWSPEELRAAIGEYDALIVRSGTQVDAALLAAGTRLKAIARAGVGVDNIDLAAATKHGIPVMNSPTANSITTAEQTLCLMLAVSRHTAPAHASVAAGEWRRSEFVGRQLHGKTLGIVGFGTIGRLVGERARAFGMHIEAFDPFVSDEDGAKAGATMRPLPDLLASADYLTLHAIVTDETRHMINAESLARMKPSAVLINVARGALVDANALADALRNGGLRAAAIDVFEQEPPEGNPLIGMANVLHTPHLGASTVEAQEAVATQAVDAVLGVLRGEKPVHLVNRDLQG